MHVRVTFKRTDKQERRRVTLWERGKRKAPIGEKMRGVQLLSRKNKNVCAVFSDLGLLSPKTKDSWKKKIKKPVFILKKRSAERITPASKCQVHIQ